MSSTFLVPGRPAADDAAEHADDDDDMTDTALDEVVEPAEAEPQRGRGLTLSFIVGAAFTLWGALIGIRALGDNSFLTHLATGRMILRTGHVPTHDPYSFTAHGAPWVVQSWLASVFYGVADKIGGLGGIRVFEAVLTAAIAALVWRLTRPARSLLARIVVAGLAIGVGTGMWVERPLLIGLLCFALLLLLLDSEGDLRWLVPIMWIWVNTHGSFPLAPVYLVVLALGKRLDGENPIRVLKALGWTMVGTAVSVLNPLGPKLLLFPATLLQKSSSFRIVKEWQPPQFDNPWEWLFLAQAVLVLLLLIRTRRWQILLPVGLFTVLALTAERNMVVASLLLVPAMALGARDLGSIDGTKRMRSGRVVVAVLVALGLLVSVVKLGQPNAELSAYPENAVTWLQGQHLLHDRVVAPDYVGNYLEARYNGSVPVFVDDRVDMFPKQVVHDEEILLGGGPRSEAVLQRYHAGVVVWQRSKHLTDRLRRDPHWRVAWQDQHWVVFLPAAHRG